MQYKSSLRQKFFKIGVRPATLLKRDSNQVFWYEIYEIFKNTFLQNTSTLVAASSSKQCQPMKTYTESLCCRERNDMFLDKEYSSKVFQPLLAVPHFSKVAVAEVFCKKGVLENLGNHRCFSVNFTRFSRTPFSYNTSGGCF